MDYNILYQLSNILQANDYRKLLTEFSDIINSYIPFNDSTFYLFDNSVNSITEKYQVKCYRYIKGRLYDDIISFDNFENSILEQLYLNKETIILDSSRMHEFKDFFKNDYLSQLNYKQAIGLPFINGLQVYGGIVIKFSNECELPYEVLELACELLNAKLITLNINKNELEKLKSLSMMADKENITTYSISNLDNINDEINFIIKGNHSTLVSTDKTSLIFNLRSKVYRQVVIDKSSGYVMDITDEINTHRKVLNDVYYDVEYKLYNKNKLQEEMKLSDEFTLIKLSYDNTYYLDVKKIVQKMFSTDLNSIVDGDIIILTRISDKRKLKKMISDLESELATVLTLDYDIGLISYPKDLNNKEIIIDILDTITKSSEHFYNKSVHFRKENRLIKKINIINAIKENKIELYYYPIIDLNEKLVAYYVKLANFHEEIDDKRLELRLLKLILNRVLKKLGNYEFIVDISDKLINNYDMIRFLDELNLEKNLTRKLCFAFSTNNDSFKTYLRKKKIKVAFNGDIEVFYKEKLKTDYYFAHCIYDDYSNPYLDMLSKMEGLGITKPIFTTHKIEDFNYLVENQVGYLITDRFVEESKL
ncbi:hypothetical protein RJG79_06010 [Mycoplasmatota bacterium WC44]